MTNKRKICNENLNSNQMIYIESLDSYYPTESVLNSAYRKVLDFKENAEKILEKEKLETLSLDDFAKAILDSRSFEVSLQHNFIKLKCYITLEKDKNTKKKPGDSQSSLSSTPQSSHMRADSHSSDLAYSSSDQYSPISNEDKLVNCSNGGAKKVNVEVIMKTNPFKIEESEKTTRMELIKCENNNYNSNKMLRFSYYVKSECEKFKENCLETNDGRLVLFTNDFFTIYQNKMSGEINISLNEIVQSSEEITRTEALGEKLFHLLKERPRHRALLTNECKLNQSVSSQFTGNFSSDQVPFLNQLTSMTSTQEDETYYTRELINIYGQPIVPSFHKHFNYQLSNTHYGYRTLRRLLNCDILKKFVKITKEEIKSLDRVVEFVQLTEEKCLQAFQLNITSFYDPSRFENGIVKNWIDEWYVERLKEKYSFNETCISSSGQSPSMSGSISSYSCITPPPSASSLTPSGYSSFSLYSSLNTNSWSSSNNNFLFNKSNCSDNSECDQANHLWFCLKDYSCSKMEEFIQKLKDYLKIECNKSNLILIHTAQPVFEYKSVLSETRRILALFLNKSTINDTIDNLISNQFPKVAVEHVKYLLEKFLNIDKEKKVVGFTALFEILLILKRELAKEKNDEMKYSHFLCTLERANQEKLKMAIIQLKCVPCLNKFTTNFNLLPQQQQSNNSLTNKANMVTHANMSRLLKQMSLIVSTELQTIAIDLIERIIEDKPCKFIKLKEEFRQLTTSVSSSIQQQSQVNSANTSVNQSNSKAQGVTNSQLVKQQQQKINNIIQMKNLSNSFASKCDISSSNGKSAKPIFNPKKDLEQFLTHEQKTQDLSSYKQDFTRTNMYTERY